MKAFHWTVGILAVIAVGAVLSASLLMHENQMPAAVPGSAETAAIENYGSDKKHYVYDYPLSPKRVVAIHQNAVEALLALGVGDRISVAASVDEALLRPEEKEAYERIPIHMAQTVSRETVMDAEPELIVGWFSNFEASSLDSTDFWHSRGTATYIAPSSFGREGEGQTLEDEYRFIEELGTIFQKETRAKELVDQMKGQIREVAEKTAAYPEKPRCIIVEFEGKEFRAYGEMTLGGNILQHLGVSLAFTGNHLSYEDLVVLDPDVIFLVNLDETEEGGKAVVDRIYRTAGLNDMSAVKNHRVYAVPLYEMYCSGVRSYDGIVRFARGAYPELFEKGN